MLAKVIQFMGPALWVSPTGADGRHYFIQWTVIKHDHVPDRQMAWQGCHKHLHRLQWGRSTQTPACSLGVS